jgi:hypothetical protein
MSAGQLLLLAARAAHRVGAFMLALAVLAGCGPGTGGTGTGQTSTPLESFGATPSNICTSPSSTALNCSSQTPPPNAGVADTITLPTAPSIGTTAINFSVATGDKDINLFMVGHIANLRDRCLDLHFDGEWGTVGARDSRFYGTFTIGANKQPQLASLTIEPKDIAGSGFKGLTVVLRDAAGNVVIEPVLLVRTLLPTTNPSACPL